MATMSAARIRALYRRHTQAYETVYHSSTNSLWRVVTGFSATPAREASPALYADERFVSFRRGCTTRRNQWGFEELRSKVAQ